MQISNGLTFQRFLMQSNASVLIPVYATWNPSDKNAAITLSGGNLQTTATTTAWKSVRATISKNSGKWYWEINVPDRFCFFGLADAAANILSNYVGAAANSGGMSSSTNAFAAGMTFAGSIPTNGNTAGVYCLACDLDARKMWVRKAGSAWANGDPTNPSGAASFSWASALTLFPAMSHYQPGGNSIVNFGASAFTDNVPVGFNAGWFQ